MPDFKHEKRHGRSDGRVVCGVDEVGRGPLAGPVVAAAVILPLNFPRHLQKEIRDSKKMTREARAAIFEPLTSACLFAIAEASVEEIDRLNILWASMLAMERAVAALNREIHMILVDGNRAPKNLPCAAEPIIAGDDRSYSIAAASIIAKVHRDIFMRRLAVDYPHYGWDTNAGYGTATHLAALNVHGVTVWHRSSFAPVAAARMA